MTKRRREKPWKRLRDKRVRERSDRLDGGKGQRIIRLYDTGQRDFARYDLRGFALVEANLERIDLSGADLSESILRRVRLREAVLEKANLQGADLREADLTGAVLVEADLSKANLRGAKVTEAQLASVAWLEGAILPSSIGRSLFTPDSPPAELPPHSIQELEDVSAPAVEVHEALEGTVYTARVTYRKRSRALISAKKAASDRRCEACGFSFEEYYRITDRDCLVAHHIDPIARRSGPSKTTLDDIALLCPNCHAIVHTQDPPISPEDLRRMLLKAELGSNIHQE